MGRKIELINDSTVQKMAYSGRILDKRFTAYIPIGKGSPLFQQPWRLQLHCKRP